MKSSRWIRLHIIYFFFIHTLFQVCISVVAQIRVRLEVVLDHLLCLPCMSLPLVYEPQRHDRQSNPVSSHPGVPLFVFSSAPTGI